LERFARFLLRFRLHLLLLLALLTLFLGVHANRLRVTTDFSRMVPQEHAYIKSYLPFKKIFGGGNQLKVEVSRKDGSILTSDFLLKLRQITDDVMFVKGIDRLKVRSLVSPETLFVRISEEGFDRGPVVPYLIPEDEEELATIGDIITAAKLKGRLVSMDMKSALITAEIYEMGVDYLSVYRQLEEIRSKYTDEDISIHINGFAMVVGFVNDALPKIVSLFALSIFITFLILYRFFRYLRLALLPLLSGALSVLWSLGIASLIGINLDPMTSIAPFLVLAIGVSHGIQMIKRYMEQCVIHPGGYNAALHALAGLILPGVAALVTDAIGFLTILFVPIGVIRDLALMAGIGVICILLANTLVLPLILSLFPNFVAKKEATREQDALPFATRILTRISMWTVGRNAYRVTAGACFLLLIGVFTARTVTVGDVNPGEPLLWEDSQYNQDAARMMNDFLFGTDWLSVAVAGDEDGICKQYDVVKVIEDYEEEIGSIPGVTVVISGLLVARAVNQMLHEGDIRWLALPKTQPELAYLMSYAGSKDDNEMMSMGCKDINVRLFLSDHKGATLRRVVDKTEEFMSSHPLPGAKFVLAGGNAGVMAATNLVVGKAQVPMLLLVYLSILLLCFFVYRNIKAPFFILSPLLLVSVISTAFMKMVGLGLNVNTLPVAALGVGIGVDYGIYIYSRLAHERKKHSRYEDAVRVTLLTTGTAVFYTALTLSAGVLTWIFSDLKFQADMGLLLGFIFIMNMIGAVVLMPSLVYVFDARKKRTSSA
jgi:predicted RND superfamily exporter protein